MARLSKLFITNHVKEFFSFSNELFTKFQRRYLFNSSLVNETALTDFCKYPQIDNASYPVHYIAKSPTNNELLTGDCCSYAMIWNGICY